jgi:hypothetical protein
MLFRAALPFLLLFLAGCGGGGGGDDNAPTGERRPVLGRGAEEEAAAAGLGFPGFATKNTTRVGGADGIADAAAVAQAIYPSRGEESRPDAVALVDAKDWRTAISAAQLMARPVRAPMLFADGDNLPAATKEALERLSPKGASAAGDAQVIRVGKVPKPGVFDTTEIPGKGYAEVAAGIDKLVTTAARKPSASVLLAPADSPAFAMPAAGWAAKSGDPVLWVNKDTIPTETREAILEHRRPRIYVLGPESVVSKKVLDDLDKLGSVVTRISGPDPVRNAIAFARFSDGKFGWNVVDPGHGVVFASAERVLDAAAAAPLSAAGAYGPLLLVADARKMPAPLQEYLLDIQPGFDADPVRGVYNHGWVMGDEKAVSVDVQARLDTLLEIQPVDATSGS